MPLTLLESRAHKVFIVDDDSGIRKVLRRFVAGAGWEPIEFDSAESMLEEVFNVKPALVILDIQLKKMNGLEGLQEIRKKFSKVSLPVLIVSGSTKGEEIAAALSAGANDYVTKPIDKYIFKARMRLQIELYEKEAIAQKQRRALINASFLQTATNNVMPDPMVVLTQNGEVVQSNEALIAACGNVAPASWSELCNQLFSGKLVDQDGYDPHDLSILRKSDFEAECKIQSGSKTFYYTALHRQVDHVLGGEGVVLRVWRDITAMKEHAKQQAQLSKLEAMELFAAGVAHNFNNILGSIASATELISKVGGNDPKCTRCVSAIKCAVTHGSRLTGKIVRTLKEKPHHGQVADSFGALVQQCIAIQKELFGERFFFQVAIEPGMREVCVDSSSLQEILYTLIQNATDAMPDGGAVTVQAREAASKSGMELIVADTGCGIPPSLQGKIFEPFYSTKSLDDRNKVSVNGRGLGLWGIYSLLKSYGGSIECISEEGKGTKFIVVIPYSQALSCPVNLPTEPTSEQ